MTTSEIEGSNFFSPSSSSTLSISSFSSSSTLSDVSPLPSPSIKPRGSKTSAFFSSPFSPPPLAKVLAPERIDSPQRSASESSATSQTTTPTLPQDKAAGRARSLNADFFALPNAESRPIPPASPSRETSPPRFALESPPPPRLPPLHRLFPSRAPARLDANSASFRDFPAERETTPTAGNESANSLFSNWTKWKRAPSPVHGPLLSASPIRSPSGSLSARIDNRPLTRQPTPLPEESLASPLSSPAPALPLPLVESPTSAEYEGIDREEQLDTADVEAGAVISDLTGETRLTLVSVLGQGAFSSVWLARGVLQAPAGTGRSTPGSRQGSIKRRRLRRLDGMAPKMMVPLRTRDCSMYMDERDGEGASAGGANGGPVEENEEIGGRLVAVKLTDRTQLDLNDRTRISFVREVEVLRHISHPSIVTYLGSFTTPTHYCLTLEHVSGGELFDLIDTDENHGRLTEPLLRRMWGELCKAVGWMHGVGLVHRDIKLENILLTVNPFKSPESLPALPAPLVKLTDFGLARFIDPVDPWLSTRCGSESYAAPELVTGRRYDGRQTDAWACGVVLFALATRRLPFEGEMHTKEHPMRRDSDDERRHAYPQQHRRKRFLMRIAKAEYEWPEDEGGGAGGEARGTALAQSAGVRRVVERLLVRDPAKRARVVELWDEEWMRGEGAPGAPAAAGLSRKTSTLSRRGSRRERRQPTEEVDCDAVDESEVLEDESGGEGIAEVEGEEDGLLMEPEAIDSIAHQELQ